MIEIKPLIQHYSNCPHCRAALKPFNLIWQGMHICAECQCVQCNARIIEDIKVGHSIISNYQVDLEHNLLFGSESATRVWLGEPLIKSLLNPKNDKLKINKEVFNLCKNVVILNCIDFLYGHCLLKLLNRHLRNSNVLW